MKDNNEFLAKGSFWMRLRSTIFLLPAWFSPHSSLRVFFHRLRGVRIDRNVEIGYYCHIGNVHPKSIHISDNVVIAANCVILEHDNSYYFTHGKDVRHGDIFLEEGAFIGIGSVILPGVTIGSRAIVGALSLVKSDVPPCSVVVGQPAKLIKIIIAPSISRQKIESSG